MRLAGAGLGGIHATVVLCVLLGLPARGQGPFTPVDVSSDVVPTVVGQRLDLDRVTRQRISILELVVTNLSGQACLAPLHLVIDVDQDGVMIEGATPGTANPPLFSHRIDLSPSLDNAMLPSSGAVTCQVVLVSDVDQFYGYDLRIEGYLNQAPVLEDGGPYAATLGSAVSFDASGTTDPEGHPITYHWSLGDGNGVDGLVGVHTYSQVGTYQVRLTAMDILGATSSRQFQVPVVPAGAFALARTRSLDPVGHPLGRVTVTETGPGPERNLATDAATGFATLGEVVGNYQWQFEAEGHLPAWRWDTLVQGEVAVIPNPWLPLRNPQATEVSPIRDVRIRDESGGTVIVFPAGAIGQVGPARITHLDSQTLPGPLPVGWSPLAEFWVELPAEPTAPGTATCRLEAPLRSGDVAAVARWDETSLSWKVLEQVTGSGSTTTTVSVAATGAHALVVADGGDLAPSSPVLGQPLSASTAMLPNASTLVAEGRVVPNPAVASRDPDAVTATVTVTFTATNPVPSGLILRCDIEESYRMTDGSVRKTPGYETFITAYQRPGDATDTTLHARFPLRPRLLLGPEELEEARVLVRVLPAEAFSGAIVNEQGGVASGEGVQIEIATGALTGLGAVEVHALPVEGFASLGGLPPDAVALAFALNVPGLTTDGRLTPVFATQAPDGWFVLARVRFGDGYAGLEPVERFASDSDGRLQSLEPGTGDRLPGVIGAGQYVLIQVDGPQGLLAGIARNPSGDPAGGLVVSLDGLPWLTLSAADGSYRLVAPVGETVVRVRELGTGNEGSAIATIVDPDQMAVADITAALTGPWIVTVDPADGATGVRRASPVTVHFSEPVDPAGFANQGIVLVDTNAQAVAGTLGLSHDGREGSLLPGDILQAGSAYTVLVSPAITDATGLPIEGPLTFQFTTAAEAARGAGGELVIYEPGSTNCPAIGAVPGYTPGDTRVVCVTGSQGTADPEVPVILVNYGSGQTATVLSNPDGSFISTILAAEEDLISAVFINASGTRIEVPAARQVFDDGRVGLYEAGGLLSIDGPEGPVDIVVHPGTIGHRNVFQIQPLVLEDILQEVTNSPPDLGHVVAGFAITAKGDVMDGPSDVSLPFDPAVLGLPPGESPEDGAFALTVVRETESGKAYQVVDKLKYEQGRLRSNTFTGLLASLGANTLASAGELIASVVFLGSKPLVVNGRTLEYMGTADPERGGSLRAINSGELQEDDSRPLPGALVALHLVEGITSARPGTIHAGTFYSSSDQDGRFSLVAPVSGGQFVVSGTHTRFADYPTTSISMAADLAFGTVQRHLYFTTPVSAVPAPRVHISHVPRYPRPGELCELRATVSGAAGTPGVSLAVTGPPGVAASNETTTVLGLNRTRLTAEITSDAEAAAQLELTASDSGRTITVPYRILFTFQPPESSGTGLTPSDPEDAVGPMVIRSDPPPRGTLSPREPIRLVFDEAISADVTNLASQFTVSPGSITPAELRLSADQARLDVFLPPLPANTSCTLTVPTSVEDLNGNLLGDSPDGTGPTAHLLEFLSARTQGAGLSGVVSGGGLVTRGAYAYALDRGEPAHIRIFDISNPTDPTEVNALPFGPGYPRDLVFIPQWSYEPAPGRAAVTNDLLAVVGGKIGATQSGDEGYVLSYGQALRIYNVSDPPSASRTPIASLRLTLQQNAVTKVMWAAPHLAYLETGADLQQVGVIDLQEMLTGQAAPLGTPDSPRPGLDVNGDGDYTDADIGDEVPLPPIHPPEFFGKKYGMALEPDDHSQIRDFYFDRGYCGMVMEGQPSAYRTFLYNGQFLAPASGIHPFGDGVPIRRMTTLFQVELEDAGITTPADLVLVTLSTPYRLAVIDITDPMAPHELAMIPFPDQDSLAGLYPREDGLMAIAAGADLILLDPARLAISTSLEGTEHPAVVDVVPGMGSVSMTFDPGNPAGVYVTSHGGKSRVLQTAPALQFVSFPLWPAVVDPMDLPGDPQQILDLLRVAVQRSGLPPARFREVPDVVRSTLSPADPAVHYHVLVDAPGGAGATIQLAAESLSAHGRLRPHRGAGFAPTRAVSSAALGTGYTPGPHDPPILPLLARRLSDNRADPAFNRYLSEPIALTYERVSSDELDTLDAALPVGRKILWSGAILRASIDPAMDSLGVLGPYLAIPNPSMLVPGVSTATEALSAPYAMGPNPPPLGGAATLPYTLGLVNAHNAEIRQSTTDKSLPSRRMGISLERTIGGQDLYYGPFGRGWDFNYNQHVQELQPHVFPPDDQMPLVVRSGDSESVVGTTGDILFHSGYGRLILFRDAGETCPPEASADPLVLDLGWDTTANRFYLPERGIFDLLFRFPDRRFVRLTRNGTRYWYNALGKLEKMVHRYTENTHRLTHNAYGELVRITDQAAEERYLRFGYYRLDSADPEFDLDIDETTSDKALAGLIRRVRDPTGREQRSILYEYAPEGRLVKRLDVHLEGANDGFGERPVTEYLWDTRRSEDIAGLKISQGEGQALFAVSHLGGPPEQPVVAEASTAGATILVTAPSDNTAAAMDGSETLVVGPYGATRTYTFDPWARPARMNGTGPGAGDATYNTTYSPDGLLERSTNPEGDWTRNTYTDNSPSLRSRANLTEIERFPIPGLPGSTVSAKYPFALNSRYNLPEGSGYDFNGMSVTYHTGSDRDVQSVDFEESGSLVLTYNEFGQVVSNVSPEGVSSSFEYDPDTGYLLSDTRGGYPPTAFIYTGEAGMLGRPSSIIHPRGAPTTDMIYDNRLMLISATRASFWEERGYDANGNLTSLHYPVGQGREFDETTEFTQLNLPRRSTLQKVEAEAALVSLTTHFTPDSNAPWRLASVDYPGSQTRTFGPYDHLERVTKATFGTYSEDYEWDGNGNLRSVGKGGVTTTVYTPDGHNRVSSIVRKTGSSDPDPEYSFAYHPAGQLRSVGIEDGSYGLAYGVEIPTIDGLGRTRELTRHGEGVSLPYTLTYDDGARSLSVTGPLDYSMTSVHDRAGYPAQMSTPLIDATFTVDGNGNIAGLDTDELLGETYHYSFSFDDLDHLTSLGDNQGQRMGLTPRLDGLPTRVTDPQGHDAAWDWSVLGEPLSRTRGTGASAVQFDYEYDERRLPSAVTDSSGGGLEIYYDDRERIGSVTLQDGAQIRVNAYDGRNNPTQMSIPSGTISAVYDLQGRVTDMNVAYAAGGAHGTNYTSGFNYDSLDRVRYVGLGSGDGVYYDYDPLGPLTQLVYRIDSEEYGVATSLRRDGLRTNLLYSSGVNVQIDRDFASGRFVGIGIDGTGWIYEIAEHRGIGLRTRVSIGGGVIQELNIYDNRKRLLGRRYERADGTLLVDVRYAFASASNNTLVARQYIHRGGRADLYGYDSAGRLTSAEMDARPTIPDAAQRSLPGFSGPTQAGIHAGQHARVYRYSVDGLDRLTGSQLYNPDGLPVFAFAETLTNFTASFHPETVDGFDRGPTDPWGNTARLRLQVHESGATAPRPESAALLHNGLSHLVEIQRGDGVTFTYSHLPNGLCYRRAVDGPTPSVRTWIYDGALLIEEYEAAGQGSPAPVSRYYYAGEDVPVAADLKQADGLFHRYYFLRGGDGSILAVADEQGHVVERVRYDPWGRPRFELPDTRSPHIAWIRPETNGLLVCFSETVLPPLVSTTAGSHVMVASHSLTGAVTLTGASGIISNVVVYRESAPGSAFGSTLSLATDGPMPTNFSLEVQAASLLDEWGNPNPPQTLSLSLTNTVGGELYRAAITDTSADRATKSVTGNPFLFHGQYFDYDTGLLYLRKRFYDPYTGLFLQQDPAMYSDSVNQYVAFRWDPVNRRDPMGTFSDVWAEQRGGTSSKPLTPPPPQPLEPVPPAYSYVGRSGQKHLTYQAHYIKVVSAGSAKAMSALIETGAAPMAGFGKAGTKLLETGLSVAGATLNTATAGSSANQGKQMRSEIAGMVRNEEASAAKNWMLMDELNELVAADKLGVQAGDEVEDLLGKKVKASEVVRSPAGVPVKAVMTGLSIVDEMYKVADENRDMTWRIVEIEELGGGSQGTLLVDDMELHYESEVRADQQHAHMYWSFDPAHEKEAEKAVGMMMNPKNADWSKGVQVK